MQPEPQEDVPEKVAEELRPATLKVHVLQGPPLLTERMGVRGANEA